MGQRGGDIERGQRIGDVAEELGLGQHRVAQLGEDRELDLERRLMRPGDPALELGQLRGGEPHGVGHGLAVDEALLRAALR